MVEVQEKVTFTGAFSALGAISGGFASMISKVNPIQGIVQGALLGGLTTSGAFLGWDNGDRLIKLITDDRDKQELLNRLYSSAAPFFSLTCSTAITATMSNVAYEVPYSDSLPHIKWTLLVGIFLGNFLYRDPAKYS